MEFYLAKLLFSRCFNFISARILLLFEWDQELSSCGLHSWDANSLVPG